MNSKTKKILSWIPATLIMVTIFYLSSLAGDKIQLPAFRFSDKAVHFAAYATLGLFLTLRIRSEGIDYLGLCIGIVFGLSDEFHQYFVPLRDTSFFDFLADGLGVVFGIWLGSQIIKRFLKKT